MPGTGIGVSLAVPPSLGITLGVRSALRETLALGGVIYRLLRGRISGRPLLSRTTGQPLYGRAA